MTSSISSQTIEHMAQKILHDPVLMEQLCDRIYYLLATDRRIQQERSGRQP